MRRAIIGVLLISFGLLLKACNTTEPPPGESLVVKLEDVSCTEAWLKLTATNLQLPTTVTLKQNNQTISTINLVKIDTLLYIDSLLPNTTYKYQVSCIQNPVSSNELSVTTMDTTSHNFTFETFNFGGTAGSSAFYDVAIISENDIWAVGEIYIADTSQNGYTMYNALHWNGNVWELKRILYNGNIWSITTIFAFNENDIWFSAFVRYDGQNFIELPIPPILMGWSINKIWGSGSNDLYVVGNNGNLAHYNGSQWTKIESGTELNIYDIWGDYNNATGEYEIIAVAANRSVSTEKQILKIINTVTVTPIVTEGIPYSIVDIWFEANRRYYVGGAGLFSKTNIETNEAWEELTVSNVYLESIDGEGLNDIVICGSFGELMHYNGVSWRRYDQLPGGSLLLGVKIRGDMIVTVGIDNPKAFIAIGHR